MQAWAKIHAQSHELNLDFVLAFFTLFTSLPEVTSTIMHMSVACSLVPFYLLV